MNLIELSPSLERIDKDGLIRVGRAVWPITYQKTEDDKEALINAAYTESHRIVLNMPNYRIMVMGSALWYHQGLNQITIGHKFCAALLATKVTGELLKHVHPPWRCFYINLPNKMFFVQSNESNSLVDLVGVMVFQNKLIQQEMRWGWFGITNTSTTLWRHGYTSEMLEDDALLCSPFEERFSEELEDIDKRTTIMLSKLIINVCLAFNDPTQIIKQPKEPFRGWHHTKSTRKNSMPYVRNYVLGKEKIVDCRAAVQDYLLTGRTNKGLTVQKLVTGHFKPKLGERLGRPVWIEPYWKGKEGAPILTTHKRAE